MKILLIIALSFFGLLTFTQKNNLSSVEVKPLNELISTGADTVSRKEFRLFLEKELIDKMGDCYFKQTQMTKCPEYVRFRLIDTYSRNPKCYKNATTRGILFTDGCFESQTICEFRAIYGKNELEVKESFFSDWQSANDFSKKFCDHMEQNRR